MTKKSYAANAIWSSFSSECFIEKDNNFALGPGSYLNQKNVFFKIEGLAIGYNFDRALLETQISIGRMAFGS